MKKKTFFQRWFCILTTFVLLVSGICSIFTATDSLLKYAENSLNDTSVYLLDSFEFGQNEKACLDETLSAKSTGESLNNCEQKEEYSLSGTFSIDSDLAVLPAISIRMNKTLLQKMEAIGSCCKNRIICYIHLADGAKG